MKKKAILCVDDEPIILDSLHAQLSSSYGEEFLYEFAESAEDAWEIIEDLEEDEVNLLVIVSDWLMPEIKGDEFLISVHKKYPGIRFIMLTGHVDQGAIDNARREAGLEFIIPKPWVTEDLLSAINGALEEK